MSLHVVGLFAVLVTTLARLVNAQNTTQTFFTFPRYPNSTGSKLDLSQNLIWEVGQPQNIQWETVLANYSLLLYQLNLDEQVYATTSSGYSIFAETEANAAVGDFTWEVQTYKYNLNHSNVFFLEFDFPDMGSNYIDSGLFNISIAKSTSTISTTSATSTSGPTSTNPITTSSPISSPVPQPSSGLSTGAKAGIGVGAGLGALALLAIGAFAGLRHRKSKKASQHQVRNDGTGIDYSAGNNYGSGSGNMQDTSLQDAKQSRHSAAPAELPVAEMNTTAWRPAELNGS